MLMDGEQIQAVAKVLRVRKLLIRQRSHEINAPLGHLAEFERVMLQGAVKVGLHQHPLHFDPNASAYDQDCRR